MNDQVKKSIDQAVEAFETHWAAQQQYQQGINGTSPAPQPVSGPQASKQHQPWPFAGDVVMLTDISTGWSRQVTVLSLDLQNEIIRFKLDTGFTLSAFFDDFRKGVLAWNVMPVQPTAPYGGAPTPVANTVGVLMPPIGATVILKQRGAAVVVEASFRGHNASTDRYEFTTMAGTSIRLAVPDFVSGVFSWSYPVPPANELAKHIGADCSTHDWKTYVGFTERFDYCARCDKKRTT